MVTAGALAEVTVAALNPSRLDPIDRSGGSLGELAEVGRRLLTGRTVWNVNSTAAGGGVAEMLRPLIGYCRGAEIDMRWLVIGGDPRFFDITKRVHNGLHGNPGDGGDLGDGEQDHYERQLAGAAAEMRSLVKTGDVVILHDPQTGGLVPAMREAGAIVVWRCHVGSDNTNDLVERSWDFLRPCLEQAHVTVFTRREYVPSWLSERARIIPPSIDPFTAKNQPMDPVAVRAIVEHVGVVQGGRLDDGPTPFTRWDGSPARVDHVADIMGAGPAPAYDSPLVVQISRWDRLKDMVGVMRAFADHVAPFTDAHLALVGPNVSAVADDPEGVDVYLECLRSWRALPHAVRTRVLLVNLPMHDVEENAAIVNALQRHAAVVVQKSLAEGFGLTVTEAMWKARPVVASAVGGISDQIVDGEHGLLIDDPSDLRMCGEAIVRLLNDGDLATRLGDAAQSRVAAEFLSGRHLRAYVQMLTDLFNEPASPTGSAQSGLS